MHVLVTEARFGDSDRLVARLRDLGIRVTGCHDRVQQCRALQPGQRCPLDDFVDSIDVVLDVRGPGAELTAREYGAVCGERARRPVWVVSASPDVPVVVPAVLRNFAIAATEEQFLTMCLRRQRDTVRQP